MLPQIPLSQDCVTSRAVNLYFKHNTCNSALDYVCSIKAVDAVRAKYTSLFTDCAAAVDPESNISSAITYNPCAAKYYLETLLGIRSKALPVNQQVYIVFYVVTVILSILSIW